MLRDVRFATLVLLFALAAPAQADELAGADFYVDVFSHSYAEAYVWVPVDAAVEDVVVWSDDWGCEFGPAVEEEPGLWVATGGERSSVNCWEMTASIVLAGSGGASAFDQPCGPFVGLEKVKLSGRSQTDSYDPATAAYSAHTAGAEGHVCSNGKIELSGSAVIHGDAHHGYSLKTSGSARVTGRIEMLPEPLELAPVDPMDAADVNDNQRIPYTDRGNYPLLKGEFRMSGGESVELDPGVYFFSKLQLSGGAALRITGPTVIYVTGAVKMSGGSIVNETRRPSDLELFVLGGSVKLSGSSDLHATVYAPESKIERTGASHFYGTLVGRELKVTGNGGLHGVASGSDAATEPVTVDLFFVSDAT